MSARMVHTDFHGELGLLLLEELMGGKDGSCRLSQAARMATLAALCQVKASDVAACSRTVLGLSEVPSRSASTDKLNTVVQHYTFKP